MTPLSIRVAAIIFILVGAGFGLSAIPVIRYILRNNDLPVMMFGIRAFSGPFERFGWSTFTVLLGVFAVLSLLEVLAGIWLWSGSKQGAILGLVLSGVNLVFWIGFALPFPLILGPLRVLLVLFGWRSLH